MSTLKINDYLERLNKSRLVPVEELQQTVKQFAQQHNNRVSIDQLGQHLIQQEMITAWHHQMLVQGKACRFFLAKYKLLSVLEGGGMGVVYLAQHTLMRRQVAIKVLPPDRLKNQKDVERFVAEARLIAQLDHPHIVHAFNVDSIDDAFFLVLEYIAGQDLEKTVAENGPLAADQAARFICQAARGLGHAHQRGIIHRDIKPSNLLLDAHQKIKIVDMGVALLTQATGDHSTSLLVSSEKQNVVGTMDYLAPEQALGRPIDARADLYSLGCTLYYLLTGKPPFAANSMHGVLLKHQSAPAPNPSDFRSEIPEDLSQICQRLMSKNPEDRYSSGEELAGVLQNWLVQHNYDDDPSFDSLSGSRIRRAAEDTAVLTAVPTMDLNLAKLNLHVSPPPVKSSPPRSLPHNWLPQNWLPQNWLPNNWMLLAFPSGATCLLLLVGLGWWMTSGNQTASSDRGSHTITQGHGFVDPTVKWDGILAEEFNADNLEKVSWLPDIGLRSAPGKFGQALLCQGTAYPTLLHRPEFHPTQLSVMTWVYVDQIPSGAELRKWLVSKNANEHDIGSYALVLRGGKVGAFLNMKGQAENLISCFSSNDVLQPGVWQHVAWTYNGSELIVYHNGTEVARQTVNQPLVEFPGTFAIGKRPDNHAPGHFLGRLDDVRLFSRALTPDEIQTHASTDPAQLPAETLSHQFAYFPFDDVDHWRFERGQGAIYPLIDDHFDLPSQLSEGGGKLTLNYADRYSGVASVQVTPDQRHLNRIPGLHLPIRLAPALGEYRYIRFAWKKQHGERICIQFAADSAWGPKDGNPKHELRYSAGPHKCYTASRKVAPQVPSEWTVVTRDMAEDFGEFNMTGLALSPMDGQYALFDHFVLARELRDFDLFDAQHQAQLAAWPSAPVRLKCGLPANQQHLAPGFGLEQQNAVDYNSWPKTAVRTHCYHRAEEMQFRLLVPPSTPGLLRLFFSEQENNTRRQRVTVAGREVGEVFQFKAGRWLVVPISAEASANGQLDVHLQQTAGVNTVVSDADFLPLPVEASR